MRMANVAGVTGAGPGGVGGVVATPTVPAACRVSVAIGVGANVAIYTYILMVKPWLETTGVLCPRHYLAELSDWVMVALVAAVSFGIAGHASRRWRLQCFIRRLIAAAVILSVARVATVMAFQGTCAIPEMAWCCIFISIGLNIHLVAHDVTETGEDDLEVAKSEVAKVLGGLTASTWSDEGADGNLESGNPVACSICLCDLEPGDSVKTTPCNHSFHEGCLQSWLLSSMCRWKAQSCAVCRRDLRCIS
ncbi:unnamed protein product [Prorocentrum cordatum]|uniref:RING-type domain-containing protein n=1 Tax=Prorocentrum cordatum TaxID=2364126 RepID=A0ABN9WF27_9DINO|nr:unnamed protein product [Polarella glacialis]